jgi:uncharacterized protein
MTDGLPGKYWDKKASLLSRSTLLGISHNDIEQKYLLHKSLDMILTVFRESRPGTQLMFTGFVVLVVFLAVQIIAALIAIPLFGFDTVMGMFGGFDFSDRKMLNMMKFFQVFQSIGLFVLPSLVVARLYHPNMWQFLSLNYRPTIQQALWVTILIISVNPFINFTGAVNAEMHFPEWLSGMEDWMRNAEENAEKIVKAFLHVDNIGGLLFNLFMIAVLPALGEELLFRGVIQQLLTRITKNPHWGIWLSAILFSALHMQFYGFIPRMLLGAMFGYLLIWSGSLWLPVIAHFVNNAGAVILLFLIDKNYIGAEIEEFGSGTGQWYIAVASLTTALLIFFMFRKQYAKLIKSRSLSYS